VTTSGAIAVREAEPGDVNRLLEATARLGQVPLPPWRTAAEIGGAERAALREALAQPGDDHVVLVAADGEEMLGFVYLREKVDYFTGKTHAHVDMLAVAVAAPRCRRAGRPLAPVAGRRPSAARSLEKPGKGEVESPPAPASPPGSCGYKRCQLGLAGASPGGRPARPRPARLARPAVPLLAHGTAAVSRPRTWVVSRRPRRASRWRPKSTAIAAAGRVVSAHAVTGAVACAP